MLAGSFPPLVGWAAVTGTSASPPLALAAVIFLWTPPHFWALPRWPTGLRAAGIPMLPVVAGHRRTAQAMLVYAIATVIVSVVPVLRGDLGILYLGTALGAGSWFVAACAHHLRSPGPATARKAFLTSLGYLDAHPCGRC